MNNTTSRNRLMTENHVDKTCGMLVVVWRAEVSSRGEGVMRYMLGEVR